LEGARRRLRDRLGSNCARGRAKGLESGLGCSAVLWKRVWIWSWGEDGPLFDLAGRCEAKKRVQVDANGKNEK
jgi:hypothetical protein